MERCEQTGRVLDKRGEDELIATLLEASPKVQRQGIALDNRISLLNLSIENAVEADGQVDFLGLFGEPDQAQVGN